MKPENNQDNFGEYIDGPGNWRRNEPFGQGNSNWRGSEPWNRGGGRGAGGAQQPWAEGAWDARNDPWPNDGKIH